VHQVDLSGALICHLTQYLYCSVMLQFVKVCIDLGMTRNPGVSLGAIIVEPERHILIKHLGTNLAEISLRRNPLLKTRQKEIRSAHTSGIVL
jgi:hypothetical protein